MKKCPKCTNKIPLSDFYKCKTRKSGYDVYCKQCQKEARAARRKEDPNYRIRYQVYNNINNLLKMNYSSPLCKKYLRILGYTHSELVKHLCLNVPDGFEWEDYLEGKLQIDHKKPINEFDLTDSDQLKECWSLDNLQLLTPEQNKEKAFRCE